MAAQRIFTEAELEAAQQKLAELPDLSRNKISQADFLDKLKEQIIALSKEKGYDVNDIKAALLDVGVKVTGKDVEALINPPKRTRSPRRTADAGTANPAALETPS